MNNEKLTLDVCLSNKLISNYDLTNTCVVVIDVVRASSTICTALSYGVEHIIALDNIEDTLSLKSEDYLTAGERNGDKIPECDYGNSPINFMDRKLEGKKLAITTTNGTKTLKLTETEAKKYTDSEIIIGCFVNYSNVRTYLMNSEKNVLFVCSGWQGNLSIEDTIFAGKLTEDLMRYGGKYKFVTDAPNHAVMVYKEAQSNFFDFLMDYSVRFKEKISQLSQDIRYCLKENVAEVLPKYEDGKIINIS